MTEERILAWKREEITYKEKKSNTRPQLLKYKKCKYYTTFLKIINYQIQITQILITVVTVKHFLHFLGFSKARCDEPSAPTTRPPVVFSLRSQFFAFRTQK